MEKNKKTTFILFFSIYLILSIVIIRGNMLVNRGYEFQPSIVEDSIKSLIQVPFALPQKEELTAFGLFTSVIFLYGANKYINPKKYRNKEEYGSAKWGSLKNLKPYIDKQPDENILFSENTKLALDKGRARRNNNVFVVGGSGAGKSRFMVKPNLLQQHSNYVITDPKGEMLQDTGKMFEEAGYNIKVLDLYQMDKSFKYNPFAYIEKEQDILILIDNLINNTQGPEQKPNDPFWEKAEQALLQSLIAYIHFFVKEKELKNFNTVLKLLDYAQGDEDDNDLETLMNLTHETHPDNFAYTQYQIFKQAVDKTRQSILITTGARLSVFNINSVAEITKYDEMEIDKLAEEKTIVYILISDTNQTYNFLAAMYLEQMFQRLYHIKDFGKGLKYPVRLMLDEFANIGRINQFDQRLATMRSRTISAMLITQDLAQVKSRYSKSWNSLIGNCDTFVYLGSNEHDTNDYVSKLLGQETIDIRNEGQSRGSSRSNSINHQKIGRKLLTPDELGNLDDKKSVTIIRGLDPYLDNKYPLEKHKRYSLLHEEENDKKKFDYVSYKEKLFKEKEEIKQFNTDITIATPEILEAYKSVIQKSIATRKDLTDEEKEEVANKTNENIDEAYKQEQVNQNFVNQVISDNELMHMPSSDELEQLL